MDICDKLYDDILTSFENFRSEYLKVKSNNKAAHVRTRKHLMYIKILTHDMRKAVMDHLKTLPVKSKKEVAKPVQKKNKKK